MIKTLAGVAAAVVLMTGSFFTTAIAAVQIRAVTIEKVVDGDTVHAKDAKNQIVKIRMQGIDSPESHLITDRGPVAQLPWGKDASTSLQNLLRKGDRVELEDFGRDKYGRTLGHVVINGTNTNIEQVRQGQAISYLICEVGGCTEEHFEELHAEEIMSACKSAQNAGIGVFDPANPLREMPFEFRLKHQKRSPDKFVGNYRTKQYVQPKDYKSVPVCDRVFFLSENDARNSGFTLAIQN
jgi:endonuclease YncB( thermonuclease family)